MLAVCSNIDECMGKHECFYVKQPNGAPLSNDSAQAVTIRALGVYDFYCSTAGKEVYAEIAPLAKRYADAKSKSKRYPVRCMQRHKCGVGSRCGYGAGTFIEGIGSNGINVQMDSGDFIKSCPRAPGGKAVLALRNKNFRKEEDTGQCVSIWPKGGHGRRSRKGRLRIQI